MKNNMFSLLFFFSFLVSFYPIIVFAEEPDVLIKTVLKGSTEERNTALENLVARGKQDVIPSLIVTLRFRQNNQDIAKAISTLAKEELRDWFDAMLWQQDHPEIIPHPSFREYKLELLAFLDQEFNRFLANERSDKDNLRIRLEEITWGGVKVDGIPSLDNPAHISASEANYLLDNDLVFGVVVKGEARAYPLRILGWHEMANDTINGVRVALTYCTLCRTGILYKTKIKGRTEPLVFGSSGLLYRSNKLMFDRQTDSLWNQFTGKPVSGPLVDSGIVLESLAMAILPWSQWRKEHPETTVLALETGYRRDYSSGAAYQKYFSSEALMFPVQVKGRGSLKPKDLVFGITEFNVSKAWPLHAFSENAVINDTIGEKNIVLMGNSTTRTVRAYTRGEHTFQKTKNGDLLAENGAWHLSEEALTGPEGERLARIPGRMSYWFAWDSFMGKKSQLYH